MSSAVNLQSPVLFDLHGRIALVSGGGTGIGLMIASGLAANGAKVYIGGRRKEVLETVTAEWSVHGKGTVIPYVRLEIWSPLNRIDKPLLTNSLPLDVSDRESIIKAKNIIEEKEGKLHILVNK